MATLPKEFKDLATELYDDEFAAFKLPLIISKESDSYDPRTGIGGATEAYTGSAIRETYDNVKKLVGSVTGSEVFASCKNDPAIFPVKIDSSYTAEFDGVKYSIDRVTEDPAGATLIFVLVQ